MQNKPTTFQLLFGILVATIVIMVFALNVRVGYISLALQNMKSLATISMQLQPVSETKTGTASQFMQFLKTNTVSGAAAKALVQQLYPSDMPWKAVARPPKLAPRKTTAR